MDLRKLAQKDAPLMLEWMHDQTVVGHLGTNFMEKTLDDCSRFITFAETAETDLHLAITDDRDTYMGTVSLKHIDRAHKTAEFAITVRACAMGRGFSRYGMAKILQIGLEELGLDAIYWCVSSQNTRAVRFYDKCGYCRTTQVPAHIENCYSPEQRASFLWYVVTNI